MIIKCFCAPVHIKLFLCLVVWLTDDAVEKITKITCSYIVSNFVFTFVGVFMEMKN